MEGSWNSVFNCKQNSFTESTEVCGIHCHGHAEQRSSLSCGQGRKVKSVKEPTALCSGVTWLMCQPDDPDVCYNLYFTWGRVEFVQRSGLVTIHGLSKTDLKAIIKENVLKHSAVVVVRWCGIFWLYYPPSLNCIELKDNLKNIKSSRGNNGLPLDFVIVFLCGCVLESEVRSGATFRNLYFCPMPNRVQHWTWESDFGAFYSDSDGLLVFPGLNSFKSGG